MPQYIIYGLQDPITHEIRYIGKSCSGYKRIRRHFRHSEQETDRNKHKVNWIRKLLKKNLKPIILIIQELHNPKTLAEAEVYWIGYFENQNSPLLNLTHGGENITLSQKTKDKLSQTIKMKFQDKKFCEKHLKGLKNYYQTAEAKIKKSQTTIQYWKNKQYKENHSKMLKQRWKNPEYKKKVAQKIQETKNKTQIIDNLGNIYKSINDASRQTNISTATIYKQIKNQTKNPRTPITFKEYVNATVDTSKS